MIPVVIESPFGTRPDGSRASPDEVQRNLRYLAACIRDSFARGEAPFASHGIYPMALDGRDADQRKLGMEAGFAWGRFAAVRVFYMDLGVTPGMKAGLLRANEMQQDVEERLLGGEWEV